MNKLQLTEEVAAKAGISKKAAGEAIDAVVQSIEGAMTKGEDVVLINFGTFKTVTRAARTRRIPGTDKTVDVPAKKVVKFTPGKNLKEAAN